jgi:twitching motility protein PilT
MTEEHPIYAILREARKLKASDVHIAPNKPIAVRIHGSIERPWPERRITGDQIRTFLKEDGLGDIRERLDKEGTADGSLPDFEEDLDGNETAIGPVRIHATATMDGVRLALRLLALDVAEFDSLGLPVVIAELSTKQSGLILFVGPTGSGKTTSMASLVQRIVTQAKKHVVTIEDPIEYRFKDGEGIVSQTEIGAEGQAKSFSEALRSVLRQDPDVLLVGECRDTATMAAAIEVGEQGRLCFTTVHARDASSVFDRIIGAFPADAQPQIRVSLANAFTAVVVLRLLPRKDGIGRVAAAEVLVATDPIRALIRDDKTSGIRNAITTGKGQGMQTLEADISRLVYDLQIVDEQVGKEAAVRPEEVRPTGASSGGNANANGRGAGEGGAVRPVKPMFAGT